MSSFSWSYCLNQEQFNKLYRIIKKVNRLEDFLSKNDDNDLCLLMIAYLKRMEMDGLSTPAIRINVDVISKMFDVWQKEYEDRKKIVSEFDINKVMTWSPRPKWSLNMTVKEIDYLDHFIYKAPGLPEYLYAKRNSENLYDLVLYYQMRLNAAGRLTPDLNFLFGVIKERFYRIMGDHEDAIYYVNHSHEINNNRYLNQFIIDANQSLYLSDIDSNQCIIFLNKYKDNHEPYIAAEIFLKCFKANKIRTAVSYIQSACNYIFASPNIYWHNKESIYGSVNILNTVVEALSYEGFEVFYKKQLKMAHSLICTLYLLLSRVIYWSDKETYKEEPYDDARMPITVQHKLRAYRLRAHIIETFGNFISNSFSLGDFGMMALSDLFSAHELAYVNKITGKESVYKRDAIALFHKKGLFRLGAPEIISERGFEKNDEMARLIYDKYKKGELCLSPKEIAGLITYLNMQFNTTKGLILKEGPILPFLINNSYFPSYKTEKEDVRKYLQDNKIKCFYHFTEIDRLKSIIRYGGILSYKRCLDEGIVMPVREDMAISKDIDAKLGLEDYARISFCKRLPLIQVRKSEGAKLVMLQISTEVALFEETIFTDIEATHPNLQFGKTMEDIKRVNLKAITKEFCSPDDPDFLANQAEVLVKGIIPLKYILNIRNPEVL